MLIKILKALTNDSFYIIQSAINDNINEDINLVKGGGIAARNAKIYAIKVGHKIWIKKTH